MSYKRKSQLLYLLSDDGSKDDSTHFFAWFDFEVCDAIFGLMAFVLSLPVHFIEPINRAFNEARYMDILIPTVKALTLVGVTMSALLAGLFYAKKQLFNQFQSNGSAKSSKRSKK